MKLINKYELEENKNIVINSICDETNVQFYVELEDGETREQVLDENDLVGVDFTKEEVVFCKFLDYTANLPKEKLDRCLFYSTTNSGMAYKGVF